MEDINPEHLGLGYSLTLNLKHFLCEDDEDLLQPAGGASGPLTHYFGVQVCDEGLICTYF